MNLKSFLDTAAHIADLVGPLLPAGGIVAEAIKLATSVAVGLARAEPAAETLYAEIKAAAAGSAPPSPEQWADWNARADAAHATLKAALAEA